VDSDFKHRLGEVLGKGGTQVPKLFQMYKAPNEAFFAKVEWPLARAKMNDVINTLSNARSIASVTVDGKSVNEEGATKIANWLKTCTTLTTLQLNRSCTGVSSCQMSLRQMRWRQILAAC
jgi:hypothetical protein